MESLDIEKFIESEKKELPFKNFSDDDTHAKRELKTVLQNKLLWRFIEKLGFARDSNDKYTIYYYTNGKTQNISNSIVFKCREAMQPSKWFVNVKESLPERIIFTPRFGVNELYVKESVGHVMLKRLQEEYTMPGLIEKYDLNLYQMKNIRYRRINSVTGLECFKILPPASVIVKLKDVINPDYWFIFPEEIQ